MTVGAGQLTSTFLIVSLAIPAKNFLKQLLGVGWQLGKSRNCSPKADCCSHPTLGLTSLLAWTQLLCTSCPPCAQLISSTNVVTEPRMNPVSACVQAGLDADGVRVIWSFNWVRPTLSTSPGLLIGPRGITGLPLRLEKGGI